MLIDRGEHVLSELLLLQRTRCEWSERAYVARVDHLQQQRPLPLRSHSSTVQLHAMSGDMMSCMATWLGWVPQDPNAFELEVVQGTPLECSQLARHDPHDGDAVRERPVPFFGIRRNSSTRGWYKYKYQFL